jgi:hypothetical protein
VAAFLEPGGNVCPYQLTGVCELVGGLANSPKNKSQAEPKVIMGDIAKTNGLPAQPSAPTPLDLALQRLGEAIGKPSLG